MTALRAKTGQVIPPATLPALTRSPRGTLPDLRGAVLTAEQVRLVTLGNFYIDQRHLPPAEADRLKAIRTQLTEGTGAAPAPDADPSVAAAPQPVIVQDEPVAGIELTPQQRALFSQVVAQLKSDPDAEARAVLHDVRVHHSMYPGGVLDRLFSELGNDLLDVPKSAIRIEADDLAVTLGMAPTDVQTAIDARRAEVEAQRQANTQALDAGATDAGHAATNSAARTRAATSSSAAATRRSVDTDSRAARGNRPKTIRERVERNVSDIRQQVSTEIARLDTQQRNREQSLREAVRRQVSAYRLARARDEIGLEGAPPTDSRLAAVTRWAEDAINALEVGPTSWLVQKIEAAKGATRLYKEQLDAAAATAFGSLRDWGNRQTTANEEWWTQLDTNLQTWATDARVRQEQWQASRGEATRLALARDLASVERIVALQQAGDQQAVHDYVSSLDGESQAVVSALASASGGGTPDLAGALALGVRERVRNALQGHLEGRLQQKVLALPAGNEEEIRALRALLNAVEPTTNTLKLAANIQDAIERFRGFDEAAIFKNLEGLSPLGAKLLRIDYRAKTGQGLDEALTGRGHVGWLNEDELRTADALLRGDVVEGAVGAINSAISGLGSDMEGVRRILRALPADQRPRVIAAYQDRYHESLQAALDDQWISTSVRDEAMALSRSDIRGADAIALSRTVETQYTPADEGGGGGERYATLDRTAALAVFAQIRSEVQAEGDRRGWTSRQVESEIALRSREVEASFNVRNRSEWWAQEGAQPGQTNAMRTAFALSSGPGRDMLNAVADNDMARADVARLRLEDEGVYAEDAAINAVFRDQASRSLAEVNRDLGPILRARTDEQLASEARQGRFPTEEKRLNRRMAIERDNAQQVATLANDRTRTRMDTLGSLYQLSSGRSLDTMIDANMSGVSREEAKARVEARGVLTPYQRLRFSIEGVGTDLPMLRSTLEGMTPKEVQDADTAWRNDHDGESLISAIEGDVSGRDEGDLVDLATYGAPQTVGGLTAAARRKYDRDRADETIFGRSLTAREVAMAKAEVEGLEADLALLRRRDLSPQERNRASLHFDVAVERANTAIELQRSAVDSLADTFSTIAAIAAALIVGALLSPFTGGGSALVAAAVISSLVATGVAVATKALIKGGAYGAEELGTDLAVGAVDALVAALTAGLGNALLGGATRGITPVGRSALFQGLSRMGRAGALAARAQSRVAGFLGKLGTQGVLVRGLERKAVLAGLAAETRPFYQRFAAHAAAELIDQSVQALPSSFVGALADERVWRQPGGGPMLVLSNTLDGTVQSVAMGMGFAGAAHLGSQGLHAVIGAFRATPPETRIRTGDVLSQMGRVEDRLADFKAWRRENPAGNYGDFYAARERGLIDASQATTEVRDRVRDARSEMLSGMPPRERGQYADVPILPAAEADFRRMVGDRAGDAFLVTHNGQAMILLRDGAPPSAVRALLPEVRDRVLARSGGMTLEGALPSRLREEVPIRRDPSLAGDTVRVVPIPPGGGPIRGVEVYVGPGAKPIDIALHVDAIDRVRRWSGRVGEARMALAGGAQAVGLRLETPGNRARFEAALEVRKLGPIIDERIRRLAAVVDNPATFARIEAETLHLMAQQERARRILSGELVIEARGYIAAEAQPVAQPMSPRETVVRARELLGEVRHLEKALIPALDVQIRGLDVPINNEAVKAYNLMERTNLATPEQLGAGRDAFVERFHSSADTEISAARAAVAEARSRAKPGDAATFDGYLRQLDNFLGRREALQRERGRLEAEASARAKEFKTLPEREQTLAVMNESLDYERIKRGPDFVCFAPETLVATPHGNIPIGKLTTGDTVLTDDPVGGQGVGRIVRRTEGWTNGFVEIDSDGSTLRATRSHRVRVADPDRWVPARLVVPGMRLRSAVGDGIVMRTRLVPAAGATRNLEVEPVHTFRVGPTGVLVHNGDPDYPPRDFKSPTKWPGEIYYVSIRENGVWRTVYVGSTNKEGLTFARFPEHLRQGRPNSPDFRADKGTWLRLVERAGLDVEVGVDFRRYGDIRVEVKVRGEFTDFEIAVVEEAHRRTFQESQLHNRAEAISQKAFEKYHTTRTEPCQ